jgi:hypothetical protein
MTFNWAGKVGEATGKWQLESLIRTRDGRADYTARAGSKVAWLEIAPASDAGTPAIRDSRELARRYPHPNLLHIYDSGNIESEGQAFEYTALELPDDDIAEILAGRLLTPDEARAMTAAAASALAHLHHQSLRHGNVTARSMFIVGDDVKLGVDTIAPSNPSGMQADIQQLGLTLAEGLVGATDRKALDRLPAPFRAIAAGCLNGWSARQVLDGLDGRVPAAAPPEREELPRAKKRIHPATAVAGLAVLGAAGFLLLRPSQTPKAPVAEALSKPAAATAPQVPKSPPVQPSEKPSPIQKTVQTPPAGNHAAAAGDRPWAVIAATYNGFDAAESRANSLSARSKKLHARVFPDRHSRGPFYVVLGSGLTRAEADRLRRSAVGEGAPRDSYVTKLHQE